MEMWSPYVLNYDNPIRYQDFLGDDPGDYFNEKGDYLGSDGKNDGKFYVIKTTQTTNEMYGEGSTPQKGNTNPITKEAATETETKIKEGKFEGDHMKNVVEVPSKNTLEAFDKYVKDDGTRGTSPNNNREYSATINKKGALSEKVTGPVNDPSNPKGTPAKIEAMVTPGSVRIHTHPSGTKKVGENTYGWANPPSKQDIKNLTNIKSNKGYVWSLYNDKLYVFDKKGTTATIPISSILNHKKE